VKCGQEVPAPTGSTSDAGIADDGSAPAGQAGHPVQAPVVRSNRSENNGCLPVRSEGQLSRKSSKRVHDGKHILAPQECYSPTPAFSVDSAAHAGHLDLQLSLWIAEHHLKQAEAAEILMVSRPRVSDVVNKKTAKFTIDTLMEMLSRAGKPVKLAIG
jgi:predicted XRE-type DNA-binding protein